MPTDILTLADLINNQPKKIYDAKELVLAIEEQLDKARLDYETEFDRKFLICKVEKVFNNKPFTDATAKASAKIDLQGKMLKLIELEAQLKRNQAILKYQEDKFASLKYQVQLIKAENVESNY